jgi:hypothetical protein
MRKNLASVLLISIALVAIIGVIPIHATGGGIAFVGSAGAASSSGTSFTMNYSSTTGHTIFVEVSTMSYVATVSSVTDSAGDTFSRVVAIACCPNSADNEELWSTSAGGSHASATFTVTLSANVAATAIVGEYSGISSLGSTATNFGNGVNPASVSGTLSSSSDWFICGIGTTVNSGLSANTGNLRQTEEQLPSKYATSALIDNTSSTSIACAVNQVENNQWAAVAVDAKPIDYSLSNNGPVSIHHGSTGTVTITATLTTIGATESVTLSCTSLPTGITCTSFSQNPISPTASSTLTISVQKTVARGTYSLQVTGTPLGATTGPTTVTVNVT